MAGHVTCLGATGDEIGLDLRGFGIRAHDAHSDDGVTNPNALVTSITIPVKGRRFFLDSSSILKVIVVVLDLHQAVGQFQQQRWRHPLSLGPTARLGRTLVIRVDLAPLTDVGHKPRG